MRTFARMARVFVIATAVSTAGLVATSVVKNASAAEYTFNVQVPEVTILEVNLKQVGTDTALTNASMDVVPTAGTANFNEVGMDAVIGTNSTMGFNLYLNVEGTLKDESTEATIPSLQLDSEHSTGFTCTAATAATCNFPVNTWGYRINDATGGTAAGGIDYQPAPLSGPATINSYTGESGNGITTTVYFGSRINASQPAGNYTTTINFIALAKIDALPFMQDDNLREALASDPATNYVGAEFLLYDARDNKTYQIGKQADGKYWMIENLALDPRTITTRLSSANTNMPANDTAGFADAFTTSINADKVYDSYDTNLFTKPMISVSSKDTNVPLAAGQSGTGKIGVYYNYCAATAGTFCAEYGASGLTDDYDVQYDICPKGWRLPSGGNLGDFRRLYEAHGNTTAYTNALHLNLSGWFSWLDVVDEYPTSLLQGESGSFWSSTFLPWAGSGEDGDEVLGLDIDSVGDSWYPGAEFYRHGGFSVRCVLDQKSINNLEYLQDFGDLSTIEMSDVLDSIIEEETYQLKDARDNQNYDIAKVPNGDVWMTTNLNLAGGTVLTSEDSNIAAGTTYTLPASTLTNSFSYDHRAYVYNSGNTTCDGSNPCYSYYSYVAAAAGADPSSGYAEEDICPKGWRLPTAYDYGELDKLYSSETELEGAPWYDVDAGEYSDDWENPGNARFDNFGGRYWTSTVENSSYAYRFDGGINEIQKYRGYSVRCILRNQSIVDINTMQEFSALTGAKRQAVLNSMESGGYYWLKDARDDQNYRITKLSDGKIWMVTNLNLAGGTVLTSEDSNIAAGTTYTLPASSDDFHDIDVAYVKNTGTRECEDDREEMQECYSYYSYVAAVAGTNPSEGDAIYDICPSGWRLPTKTEYDDLVSDYGPDLDYAPWYGVRAGYYDDSYWYTGHDEGDYWSSTVDDANHAYEMYFAGQQDAGTWNGWKNAGYSVRCVLK